MASLNRHSHSLTRGIIRFFRYHYLRLLRLRAERETLCRGVALGIFIGLTPTIPFHTALILLFSPIIRANIIAALAAALWVSNPLTIPIQYGLAWWLGRLFLPIEVSSEEIGGWVKTIKEEGFLKAAWGFFHLGGKTLLILQTGGLILASLPALVAYVLISRTVRKKLSPR
ncbi:DUF2062 domain-containing protein [Thermosulfuriphilus sp.]